MARAGKPLIALALLAMMGACTPQIGLVDGVPSAELSACAQQGGNLQARGRRGTVMCVRPYGDSGKSCSSSSQCQGRCLAAKEDGGLPEAGESVPGRCQPDDKLFGCFAELKDGKAVASMCID